MTISFGFLGANLGFDRSNTLYMEDEDYARAGLGTISIETAHGECIAPGTMSYDSIPLIDLATTDPDRFLKLVSHLTPILQDVFIQYYLMGRTYAQIGSLLFPSKGENAAEIAIKTGHRIGITALCVVIKTRGRISRLGQRSAMRAQWGKMLQWQRETHTEKVPRIRIHRDVGEFVIHPNGQLDELFAPSWSVLGRAGKG